MSTGTNTITGNLPLTTLQQADPVAAVMSANPAAAAASQSPNPLALPTLNPATSPYQPLTLPEAEVRRPAPTLQPQQRIQDLGATTHAGAVAYLADQVLRGAMAGWSQHQQQQLAQYNKKLAASQSLYNQQAEQLYDLARSGVDPNSQQYKDARNRTLLAWQQTMQIIGERMPQEGKGGKKGKKGAEPNDALSALYQVYHGAAAAGPPVFHQVQPFLTPEYQAQARAAAQVRAAEESGKMGTLHAAAAERQAKQNLADAQNDYYAALKTNDPDKIAAAEARVDEMKRALAPEPRYTPHLVNIKNPKTGEEAVIDTTSGQLPPAGWVLAGTNLPSVPKVGSFGDFMLGAYGPTPTPAQYQEGRKLWAESGAGTTVGTHTVLVTQGNQRVPYTFTTTSTKSFGATPTAPNVRADQGEGAGTITPTSPATTSTAPLTMQHPAASGTPAPSGAPIGYKFAPDTTKAMGAAVQAHAGFQAQLGQYRQALMQQQDILRDPTNSTARIDLVGNFLRSLGAHSAAVQGASVRLNQTEWRMAEESAPTVARALSHFAHTQNGLVWLSGVTLTPEQVTDMVQGIGESALSAKQTWEAMQKTADQMRARDAQGMAGAAPATPAAATPSRPQYKIGDIVPVRGQRIRITAISKNGQYVGVPVK